MNTIDIFDGLPGSIEDLGETALRRGVDSGFLIGSISAPIDLWVEPKITTWISDYLR